MLKIPIDQPPWPVDDMKASIISTTQWLSKLVARLKTFQITLATDAVDNSTTSSTFANAPGAPVTGQLTTITDSNTAVWGAAIAGGGANTVLAWWNGTNWTVVGK